MNEQLLSEVMSCSNLPTLPGVALQILQMARDPEADIHDMADLISTDPALSGRILKTVNSSFYGLSKSVSTISQALVILGLQSVRTLALGFSLVSSLNKARTSGFDLMTYWRRSIYSAVAARVLGEQIKLPQAEEAFLASLLQDIGMLALHTALGDKYDDVHRAAESHENLLEAEDRELGLNHAQVGQLMAEQWSLPPLLSVPIGAHHHPDDAEPELRQLTKVVHLAWRLAEVYIHADASHTVSAAKRAADEMFDIPNGKVERLLEKVNTSAYEVADLFDVNIGARVNSQSILSAAKDVLVDLTLESQKEATELKDRNRELWEAATTDPLTGLANRQRFDDLIGEEFSRAKKFLRSICVLFIDADHFKNVNDTYGHVAGDEVLRRLAATTTEACRGLGVAARYGGEEIACILPETDLRSAAHLGDAIRTAIANEVIEFEGQDISITVSVGVAGMERGAHFDTPQRLIGAADKAMYAAKKAGRNTVRISAIGTAAAATK